MTMDESEPGTLDDTGDARRRSVDTESVNTGSTDITERFDFDLSQNNPLERIWFGPSEPFYLDQHPQTNGPIMTAARVNASETDFTAADTADPFCRYDPEDGLYHMLFEIRKEPGVETGHAYSPVATDPDAWTYDGYIPGLTSSWPYLIKRAGEWYIFGHGAGGEVYKKTGDSWTSGWEQVGDLTNNTEKDRATRYFRDRYYLFVRDAGDSNILIYESSPVDFETPLENLSFSEHADSPISAGGAGTKKESPAGRPRVLDNGLEVYYLDDRTGYGGLFAARYEIDKSNSITEHEIGPISTGYSFLGGEAGGGTHHAIDYVTGGPEGTPFIVTDVSSPWEIYAATPVEKPPAHARLSNSGWTNSSGDWETVPWDGKPVRGFDMANLPQNRIDIPFSGEYRVTANLVHITPYSEARALLRLVDDTGIPLDYDIKYPSADGKETTLSCEVTQKFEAGQYIQAEAQFGAGANVPSGGVYAGQAGVRMDVRLK